MTEQSQFQWSFPDTAQNRQSYAGSRVWRAKYGRDFGGVPADCYIQYAADGKLYGKCVPMENAG